MLKEELEALQEVWLEEGAVLGSFPAVTYVKKDGPIRNSLDLFLDLYSSAASHHCVFSHSGSNARMQVNAPMLLSPAG